MADMTKGDSFTQTINISSSSTSINLPVGQKYVDRDIILTINVPIQHYYIRTAAPDSSLGEDGDVCLVG